MAIIELYLNLILLVTHKHSLLQLGGVFSEISGSTGALASCSCEHSTKKTIRIERSMVKS